MIRKSVSTSQLCEFLLLTFSYVSALNMAISASVQMCHLPPHTHAGCGACVLYQKMLVSEGSQILSLSFHPQSPLDLSPSWIIADVSVLGRKRWGSKFTSFASFLVYISGYILHFWVRRNARQMYFGPNTGVDAQLWLGQLERFSQMLARFTLDSSIYSSRGAI